MVSFTVNDIYKKASALNPEAKDAYIADFDKEEKALTALASSLARRRRQIEILNQAVVSSPKLKTGALRSLIEPFKKTVNKMDNWLKNLRTELASFNKTIKSENWSISKAISKFESDNQNK